MQGFKKIENLASELAFIAGCYEVKLQCNIDMEDVPGQCNLFTDTIHLNYELLFDRKFALSVFFHELGHIICKRYNKYPSSHQIYSKKRITKKDFVNFKRCALRSEIYVDKVAKILLKSYEPKIRYLAGYNTKDAKKQYKSYIKSIPYQGFKNYIQENN